MPWESENSLTVKYDMTMMLNELQAIGDTVKL